MKMTLALTAMAAGLAGCTSDETLSGFVETGQEFQLTEMNGVAYDHRATIAFGDDGGIYGAAPCNRYFARLSVPYPWFGVEAIGSTLMACPDLDAEAAFFRGLESMTLAEVSGGTLILSNEAGGEMVFEAF